MSSTARDAALELVRECGWAVFPLQIGHDTARCDGGTANCKTVRPLLRGWADAATSDPERVARWDWSTANGYGIACRASGLVVVDQDPGDEWPYTDTRTHSTGRGVHYLYDDWLGLPDKVALEPWGVDVRGSGMVLGPGSYHPHGGYTVLNDTDPAPVPAELVAAVGTPTTRERVDLTEVPPLAPEDALRRLEGVYRAVENLPAGAVNHGLNVQAGAAAGLWVRLDPDDQTGELAEEHVKARLLDAVPNDGNVSKSAGTIDSGWGYGLSNPLPDNEAGSAVDDFGAPDLSDPTHPPATDADVVTWLVDHHVGGRWLWAPGTGWLRWSGQRWERINGVATREALRVIFQESVAAVVKSGATHDAIKQATKLLSSSRIAAITDLLRGAVWVDDDDLDQRHDLLNVRNGTVDLRTGELRPHDPEDLLTRIAPTDYRPDATHADWGQALQAVPEDVREWLQVRLGQATTGHMTPDHRMPVLFGGGSNGKSTLLSACQSALGDYATHVPKRALIANTDAHPTELMDLRGARLAFVEETPEAGRLNVERLKQTVGTATIKARYIRQDSVEFAATHSLFIATNYRPRVDESDHGTWRRLALVTFPYTFRAGNGLDERMRSGQGGQREAVLAWLVAGARRWYMNGFPELPARIIEDTDAWRAEADRILAYLRDEHIVFDGQACVLSSDLYDDFTMWLDAHGHGKWGDQTFSERFANHAYVLEHRVAKVRTRDLDGLSLRHHGPKQVGANPRVWTGLRWSSTPV